MADHEEEGLDGSSIKPVSSLRSHFEQMTGSTTTLKPAVAPPRPVSPKPIMYTMKKASTSTGNVSQSESSAVHKVVERTLEPPAKPPRHIIASPLQPSPAVTIEPPSSPPKGMSTNMSMSLGSSPALLAASGPRSTSPAAPPSPRHFRIPSRSHTPSPDIRMSPLLPASNPPEPPPPRRSGELKRDIIPRSPVTPPVVNRAEKPVVRGRPVSQFLPNSSPKLKSFSFDDRVSPFDELSSAEVSQAETMSSSGPRPRPMSHQPFARPGNKDYSFAPPPVHHAVVAQRRNQEILEKGRQTISPDVTGDGRENRPALPARHSMAALDIPRVSTDRQPPTSSMGPPPIITKQSSRQAISADRLPENGSTFATPPKRIFSTPTNVTQTPPRPHGRSNTVDQTSERAPAHLRMPIKQLTEEPARSQTVGNIPSIKPFVKEPARSQSVRNPERPEVIPPNVVRYPDTSLSNRRPPFHKNGVHEISTRYDTRLFDVHGEFVCTAGFITRVWNIQDGEQVMSLSHGDNVKITSLVFKPAANYEDEGHRLWLGNNIGEILEVDIPTQALVNTKQVHARREVIKIYRHSKELWTLDDAGTMHLWAPDSSGSPNLENLPQSFRIPKNHTFSMVVGHELWHATGREIRIFMLHPDAGAEFQVLQRPLSQPNAGEVTSGAIIDSQPDRVYMGHNDGKVSVYSRADYTCLGVCNISMYKINSLIGVGDYLWAAYNTGMVHVYDTRYSPWITKKDWRAHDNPVISLVADRSSFWTMDRSQILSLGADNVVRLWDGLLQDDWLESDMQSNDVDFCKFEEIKAVVMTWNAGASTPYGLRYNADDADFMKNLLQEAGSPDILIFGFQELIDLEDKKTTAKSFFKSKKKHDPSEEQHMSHQYRDWRDYLAHSLDDYLPGNELYQLLHSANLVGLFTCVFVKASLRERIKGVTGMEIKRGMGGLHGNKGALVVRFMLDDTSMCFVNCHLAAGQTQTKDRNFDVSEILENSNLPVERDLSVRLDSYIGGGDGSMILDHELCILNGDLNYRIDTMSRDAVVNLVKAGNLGKLLDRDQLLVSKRKNPAFRLRAFTELPITFAPTYKYDVGTDNYDSSEKKRAPAWCDRILFRCRDPERLKQLSYKRHEVRVSDHRPVTGLFKIMIKKISQQRRADTWEECRRRFESVRAQSAFAANLHFLSNMCGLDTVSSEKLIKQNENSRR